MENLMKNSFQKKGMLVCACVFMVSLALMTGCSDTSNQKSITIMLPGSEGSGRTVLPPSGDYEALPKIYTIIVEGGGTTQSLDVLPDAGTATFNVLLGTYTVKVTGYDTLDKQLAIMYGEQGISVTANGNNTFEVALDVISTGDVKGRVTVLLDWSATGKTVDKVTLVDARTWEPVADQTVGAGSDTVRFSQPVPVTDGRMMQFYLWNGDRLMGTSIMELYRVVAGQTSYASSQKYNKETGELALGQYEIKTFPNAVPVYDVAIDYDLNDYSTLDLTWKVPSSYSKIEIKFYKTSDGIASVEPIEITKENMTGFLKEGSSDTYHYSFPSLVSKVEYTASIVTYQARGYIAEPVVVSKSTPVAATGVAIQAVPADALSAFSVYSSYQLVPVLTPEDATDMGFVWSVDDESVLTVNNGFVYGVSAGKSKVAVTSLNSNRTASLDFVVRLATPGNVMAEAVAEGISVSWGHVDGAEKYEIWRSVDGAFSEKLTEALPTDTAYLDTSIWTGKSYSYAVKAVGTASGVVVDSLVSSYTSAVTPAEPTLTIVLPTGTTDIAAAFTGISEGVSYVLGESGVTVEIAEIEGVSDYAWYLNAEKIDIADGASPRRVTVTASTPGLSLETIGAAQDLMLVVAKDGEQFSATIRFYVVNNPVTSVAFSSANGTLVATDSPVKLSASVIPSNADVKDLVWTSLDEGVATVSLDGTVTALKEGTATIRATAGADSRYYADCEVTCYVPLTHETFLNYVNGFLKTQLQAADTQFGGDWWQPSGAKYSNSDETVTVNASSKTSQNDGTTKFLNYVPATEFGHWILSSDDIYTHAANGGGAGYLGTDPLQYVGSQNKGTITVTLPYNQGTGSVKYNSVVVNGTRSGSYDVTLNGGARNIVDSDAVTKCF